MMAAVFFFFCSISGSSASSSELIDMSSPKSPSVVCLLSAPAPASDPDLDPDLERADPPDLAEPAGEPDRDLTLPDLDLAAPAAGDPDMES
jgi:hypothetical protein